MAKPLAVERTYEALFICPSDTPQKTIDGFIEKIKSTISPTKGVLKSVNIWGRRRLTYPIKHNRDGLYIFIDFTGESGTPESLKTLFRVTDFILRHMITDKVVLTPPPPRKTPEGTDANAPAAVAGSAPAAPAPQQGAPSASAGA